jgi:hypothetical protein
MGVMDTIRSIFGGLTDDDVTEPEAVAEDLGDGVDAVGDEVEGAAGDVEATADAIVDENENGLDDSVDEEMAINAVNADIEASKEAATDKLLNYPGME